MPNFRPVVQLHNHSKYSLLDAVPSPQDWLRWCLETGTPGLSITDHGTAISMFDALRSKELIKNINKENKEWNKENPKESPKPEYPLDEARLIPGVELYVKLNAEDKGHYHITAHAVSNQGYHNLMKLASLAYNDTVSYYGSIKARVTYDQIKQYKEGIMFGTGCIVGPIGQAIMRDKDKKLAEERFLMYKELFGDSLLIEFHVGDITHDFNKKTGGFDPFPVEEGQDQCTCDNNKQRGYNLFLKEMVDKYGGKCVPVTDAHFIYPEDKLIQDCLVKDTPVLVQDKGYVAIQNIAPGDLVLTHKGNWRKVEATRGLLSDKKKVELYRGKTSKITVTEDHKIWVRRGLTKNGNFTVLAEQIPEWKKAIDLEIGDAVLMPKAPIRSGSGYTVNLTSHLGFEGQVCSNLTKCVKKYPTSIQVDEDVAYFLGMFIGDGHASNGQISLAVERKEWLDTAALDRAIAKFGGVWTKKSIGIIDRWTASIGHLSRWMQQTFYHGVDKQLPADIFYSLPEDLQNRVIRGLYHADGTKKGGSVSLHLTSFQVMGIVSDWALSRGIFFNVDKRDGKVAFNSHRGYLTKSRQSIGHRYWGIYANKFIDLLHLHLPHRRAQKVTSLYENEEGFWVRLKDKKVISSNEPVFDIQVEEDHSFTTAFFVVSNCLLKNGNSNGWYFHESYHQLLAGEMFKKLQVHLGSEWMTEERFSEWIDNTYIVLDKSKSIDIKFEYHLPKIEIPEYLKVKTPDYNTQTYYYMMDLIKKHGRWNNDPVYVQRFKTELDVIMKNEKLNFIPYFLVYEDIGSYARSQGILQGLARGSAGGSLISFYLKIIHIDPIKANLPFERFLSHARIRAGSFPDIDADIGDRARGLIMKYLQDKYKLGFAQIATFQKMKTKNAIKDAMYALYGKKANDPEVMAICETVPDSPQGVDEHDFLYGYTDQEGNYNHGLLELNKTLARFFEIHPDIQRMVDKLIGTVRGWGRHASAFVISTLDLSADRVPTMMLDDEEIGQIQVTQYDASMVEKSGLVKADILVLSTLSAVSDCVELMKAKGIDYLEEENGVPLIYRLPEAPEVYADFYNKDTDSSFQFNTELIKGMVQEFAPLNRQGLADFTALARPGALDAPLGDSTAAQFYMDVRNGQKEMTFLHPDLEPILAETNGVFVYQESVMRFLVEVAGYSWEESDIIRSAIAKKKQEVIMNCFDRIRTSCKARGWDDEAIETVCQQILAFSRYSFNRSHSYAYGELGYITMYLKHFHPLEWWASILNLDLKEDKLRKYISKLGSIVRHPSLRHPSSKFEVRQDEDGKGYIVAPVSVIKGIGPKVVQELCIKGPFSSLEDFVARIDHAKCNTGGISALIKGRAADDMMDKSIPLYPERRKKFIEDFKKLRKKPIKLQQDVFNFDPLSIFLMEKQANKVFNKTLLGNKDIMELVKKFHTDEASVELKSLIETGRAAVPFRMGDVPILANIKVAEGMVGKVTKDVGLILLYEESSFSSGVSKKSGRSWSKVAVTLSDGYASLECVDWKAKKAFGWPKNSIIYVRGELKPGWKTPVCLDIHEIQRLSKD